MQYYAICGGKDMKTNDLKGFGHELELPLQDDELIIGNHT